MHYIFFLARAVIVFCCCRCCCILLMLYRPLFHLIFFDYISIELNFRTVFGPCPLINLFGAFFSLLLPLPLLILVVYDNHDNKGNKFSKNLKAKIYYSKIVKFLNGAFGATVIQYNWTNIWSQEHNMRLLWISCRFQIIRPSLCKTTWNTNIDICCIKHFSIIYLAFDANQSIYSLRFRLLLFFFSHYSIGVFPFSWFV